MSKKPHIIVIGNEKGGSGKSTVAMHVIVGLLRLGFKVGTIDLDCHQASLTNYLKNRVRHAARHQLDLPMSEHIRLKRVEGRDVMRVRLEEQEQLDAAIKKLGEKNDVIVMDTPGSDRYLSIMGHSYANVLVTPMNDSFVDLDLLAKMDPDTKKMIKPSIYTDMIHDIRKNCMERDGVDMKWVVLRNRVGHMQSRNRQELDDIVGSLSEMLSFDVGPTLGERVIFRDMFLQGMTLLDLVETGRSLKTMSNLAARQEIRRLVKMVLPNKSVATMALLGAGNISERQEKRA